jgi:oxalate decarboxylase/phosphoglucose isomerase-like protein (cupin superfamily)
MKNDIELIQFRLAADIPKGWGKEIQITNLPVFDVPSFPTGYSGKLLVYEKKWAKSSMHFHTVKHETFFVLSGRFRFFYFNPETADKLTKCLLPGDVVIIPPNNPHQLICDEVGTIIEFASTDNYWDNYRIEKGDSQTSKTINDEEKLNDEEFMHKL